MRKGLLLLLIIVFFLSSCGQPFSRLSTGNNVYVPALHQKLPQM